MTGPGASRVLAESWRLFTRRHGTLMSGAVAYFALLSIAPLLLIAITIAGILTDEQAAREQMFRGLSVYVGRDGAGTIASLLDNVRAHEAGPLATSLGVLALVYGSTQLFTQMQRALNILWGVQGRIGKKLKGMAWTQVRRRAVAFAMVLTCGAFLIVSVVVRATLSAVGRIPGRAIGDHWHAVDSVVSFAVLVGLFTVLFKVLPDVKIAWRDCAVGGLVTAVLFTIGKTAVGLYLGHTTLDTVFGAAGSVVMLVLWAYYCAQAFFFGAALTAVWARQRGRGLVPTAKAVALPPFEDDDGPV